VFVEIKISAYFFRRFSAFPYSAFLRGAEYPVYYLDKIGSGIAQLIQFNSLYPILSGRTDRARK
jgi:hypothetical protein